MIVKGDKQLLSKKKREEENQGLNRIVSRMD